MITITINEETHTHQGMADAIREIADRIEKGNTSGFDPTFELKGEETPESFEGEEHSAQTEMQEP